jgi:TPR repeat protein
MKCKAFAAKSDYEERCEGNAEHSSNYCNKHRYKCYNCSNRVEIRGNLCSKCQHRNRKKAVKDHNEGVCKLLNGESSYEEAAEHFTKAAKEGIPEGHTNMGLLHFSGKGLAKGLGPAHNAFKKAAEGGERIGQYNLALFYDMGLDVNLQNALEGEKIGASSSSLTETPTEEQAIYWYKKASKQGHPYATLRLSGLLKNGEAKFYMDKAAHHCVEEGHRFFKGDGFVPDLRRAYRLYLMAEKLGLNAVDERMEIENKLPAETLNEEEQAAEFMLNALK